MEKFCIRESYEEDGTDRSSIVYYYHPFHFNLEAAVETINTLKLGTTIFESVLLSDMAGESDKSCFDCNGDIK